MSGFLYGDNNQIKVLGWYKRNRVRNGAKVYVVHCRECAEDPELFGEGYFESTKYDLRRCLPCGCGIAPRWNEEQYVVLCTRKCETLGIKFLGWAENYRNNKTACLLECKDHGVWSGTPISRLLFDLKMCFKCSVDKIKSMGNKDDFEMIANFMSTGCFVEGTTFRRSHEYQKWCVYCPICEEENTAFTGNIYKGRLPCSCSKNQKIAYINLICDNDRPVAVKFGITNNVGTRIYLQNKKSVYKVDNIDFWTFSESKACKLAERECRESLDCGILSKEEMEDGHTETTYLYNIDKIIEIYESRGGIRNDGVLH